MKALRVKLFGKYITRLPDFNLTRHEDIPLPTSSACNCGGDINQVELKRFVPSQDLSGSMIPTTGQDIVKGHARTKMKQELLFAEYKKRLNDTSQSELAIAHDKTNVDEGVELFEREDRMVCHINESSELDAPTAKDGTRDLITTTDTNCKAIQLTMSNQMTAPVNTTSSKWVFSASIQLSLKKETIGDESSHIALLLEEDTSLNGRMIQNDDAHDDEIVAEEGVEIVPLIGSNDDVKECNQSPSKLDCDGDNIAVLYVNEGTTSAGLFCDNAGDSDLSKDSMDTESLVNHSNLCT